MTATVYADGTVRRPAGSWTPAVQSLLRHFEEVGFDGAPRAVGVDKEGYEIVTFVEGEVPGVDGAPPNDDAVFAAGELVRAMHDAQEGFTPPPDARWQRLPGAIPGDEVICHNDVLGHNFVVREGRPVALIDWELAAPGSRLSDVAAAAMWWAPLRPDEAARRYGLPTDRRVERLRLLADGYDLGAADRRRLLDTVVLLLRGWHEAYRVLGGVERLGPWAERWDAGRGDYILDGLRWVEDQRRELERFA
ncbi:MAG: phosphotransferase [Actinobacteria bacterium]|nr:phosphotransferase [Actinomycetota bacterium]